MRILQSKKRSSKPKAIGCAYCQERWRRKGEVVICDAIGYRMIDVNIPSVPVACASFACISALVDAEADINMFQL